MNSLIWVAEPIEQPVELLAEQSKKLLRLIEEEQQQINVCQEMLERLVEERDRHEHSLREIESVLGTSAQIKLEDVSRRLRGQRIWEVAVEVLADERGGEEVHYKEWFELFRSQGHLIVGKDPMNTFLTQINRSPAVRRVGKRTGRYRLRGSFRRENVPPATL